MKNHARWDLPKELADDPRQMKDRAPFREGVIEVRLCKVGGETTDPGLYATRGFNRILLKAEDDDREKALGARAGTLRLRGTSNANNVPSNWTGTFRSSARSEALLLDVAWKHISSGL